MKIREMTVTQCRVNSDFQSNHNIQLDCVPITRRISLWIRASCVFMLASPTWPSSYLYNIHMVMVSVCELIFLGRTEKSSLIKNSHKKETCADMVRHWAHPNIAMFLKVFGCYYCVYTRKTVWMKYKMLIFLFLILESHSGCPLPSHRATQLRFRLWRNLDCTGRLCKNMTHGKSLISIIYSWKIYSLNYWLVQTCYRGLSVLVLVTQRWPQNLYLILLQTVQYCVLHENYVMNIL